MQCVFCGGKTEARKATFVCDEDGDYFFSENVPAEVCTQCGEKTFSPEVTDVLLQLAKRKLKPARRVEVPVFEYSKPAGVLVGFQSENDWFESRLENDPRFLKRIASARQSLRAGKGTRIEDVPE